MNSAIDRFNSEAGNRFQLVECAAGVTQAASADHRHRQPTRRHQRRQDQRCFVADSTCRVLVHRLHAEGSQVKHLTRAQHRVGEVCGLCRR